MRKIYFNIGYIMLKKETVFLRSIIFQNKLHAKLAQ